MPCLHRQDVLFSDSHESETPSNPSNKRPTTEAAIQVSEVVGGRKKGRKYNNSPLCSFWSKPGHLIDVCWLQELEKKKAFHSRGRGPPGTALPLKKITTFSLQAMISQAVVNVLSSANKPWHFGVCVTLACFRYTLIPLALWLPWALLILPTRFLKSSRIRVHLGIFPIFLKRQTEI